MLSTPLTVKLGQCAGLLDDLVTGVVIDSDSIRVKDILHQLGVNCRHLGKVGAGGLLAPFSFSRSCSCVRVARFGFSVYRNGLVNSWRRR